MSRYQSHHRLASINGDYFIVFWDGKAYSADATQVTTNCISDKHDKAPKSSKPDGMHPGNYCVVRCCCPCHGASVPKSKRLKEASPDVVRAWSSLRLDELLIPDDDDEDDV